MKRLFSSKEFCERIKDYMKALRQIAADHAYDQEWFEQLVLDIESFSDIVSVADSGVLDFHEIDQLLSCFPDLSTEGDISKRVSRLVVMLQRQRTEAHAAFKSLLERFLADMRAIQVILDIPLNERLNHSEKNKYIHAVYMLARKSVVNAQEASGRPPEMFENVMYGAYGWDFRNLSAENQRLRERIAELENTPDYENGLPPFIAVA
jgi:hypothetical protein